MGKPKKIYPDDPGAFILQLVQQTVQVDFADDPPIGKDGEPKFDKKDEALARFPLNDLGNATRLLERFGKDLAFIPEIGWFVWNGRHWSAEEGDEHAARLAHDTARAMRREVLAMIYAGLRENETMEDFDKRIGRFRRFCIDAGNSGRLTAMLRLAQSYAIKKSSEMDAHKMKVNAGNGTLDLKPSAAAVAKVDPENAEGVPVLKMKHSRADYLTFMLGADYDPGAGCPHFYKFLTEVMPDDKIRAFLQRFYGYCLTGDTREQIILMFWGGGSNGKSTLMDLMARIMGTYAKGIPISSLMASPNKNGGQATPDLARLRSVRYVTSAEPETGERFSESVIKQMTGDERLTVRHLNKDFFEFYPEFKAVVSFNNKPSVRGIDEGFWRRICLVPFSQKFVDAENLAGNPGALPKDLALSDKLEAEMPGILNWILDGYRIWRESGLMIPDSVRAATAAYRAEANPVVAFVDDVCLRMAGQTVTGTEMFCAYEIWCADNALEPMTNTMFGRKMTDMGIEKQKKGVMIYCDVTLGVQMQNRVMYKINGGKPEG